MFKTGDIVAVFGESLTNPAMRTRHVEIEKTPNGELAKSQNYVLGLKPIMCKVIEVFSDLVHGEVGLVISILPSENAIKNYQLQPNENNFYLVNGRQCRLVKRDGKVIENKNAKYIAVADYMDRAFVGNDINSIKNKMKEYLYDESEIDEDAYENDNFDLEDYGCFFKAIEITI